MNIEKRREQKRIYHKLWRQRNKNRIKRNRKIYYKKNKELIILKAKKYYEDNRKKILERIKKYSNSESFKLNKNAYDKIYHKKNKGKYKELKKLRMDDVRKYMRIYRAKRIKIDPHYKLAINLRNRILSILKCKISYNKPGSAVRDLGCTIPELKVHLEKQFKDGMNWENHGQYGWHVDHIKPLKDFDLTDRKQFLEACHYTNLQPLWWYDNLAKRFLK